MLIIPHLQEYGALMMQQRSSLGSSSSSSGKGQVVIKSGGVPAGSFSFNVTG